MTNYREKTIYCAEIRPEDMKRLEEGKWTEEQKKEIAEAVMGLYEGAETMTFDDEGNVLLGFAFYDELLEYLYNSDEWWLLLYKYRVEELIIGSAKTDGNGNATNPPCRIRREKHSDEVSWYAVGGRLDERKGTLDDDE